VWGGLGSQLYALALRNEMLEKYPKRLIKLHLHTGGVTKRLSELDGIIDSKYLVFIDDFSPSSNDGYAGDSLLEGSVAKESFFLFLPRFILLKFGFVARMNDDLDSLKLKPWVRQIRGHYSTRQLSKEVISRMYSEIFSSGLTASDVTSPINKGIHYRLGDLLVIGTKEPTTIFNLSRGIGKALKIDPDNNFLVYSDSVGQACKNLEAAFLGTQFHHGIGSTLHAIHQLVGIEIFIGTASKITEWITIFRLIRDPSSCSIVPYSLKPLITRHFGNSDEFKNLIFY
jgi:hypothetical protein